MSYLNYLVVLHRINLLGEDAMIHSTKATTNMDSHNPVTSSSPFATSSVF